MTTSLLRMLAILVLLVPSAAAWAGDWPQWLGPTRNGVSPEKVAAWNKPPQALWSKPAGNGYSVPIVADGVVYVHAAVADKEAEQLSAFDLASGELKWTATYPRATYKSELGVGPRATPTLAGKHLVAFGITGELTCWNKDTGEKLWQINPYSDNEIPLPGFAVCSSPLVWGERVFVPVGGAGMAMAAYELATGKLAWKALDEPASSASPIVWQRKVGNDERVDVVAQTTLRTVGLDPQDGSLRWEHPLVFQPSGVSPTPLVAGSRLICTTQDTGTLALESPAADDGKTKLAWWEQDWSSYFSTGTIGADGRLFVITNLVMPLPRTDVRCIDPQTGKELWHKQGLGYFHVGLISTADDRLLLLTDGGVLMLADAGREKFQELCRATVCGGTFVNPVLSSGHLVLRDDKQLKCLKLETQP